MPQQLAGIVGYVSQSPDESFVNQYVIDELSFGMEQLGVIPCEMHKRIEQVAKNVGIAHLLSREIASLSGGEKQRLAIGAALVAGQRVLLLDEPTSSLDEMIASEILVLLKELSSRHGITVLIAEHRLKRLLPLVDSIVTLHSDGTVNKRPVRSSRLEEQINSPFESELKSQAPNIHSTSIAAPESERSEFISEIQDLEIAFDGQSVVSNLDLKLRIGSITGLIGPNGSGKSSCLWAIQGSGLRTSGSVLIKGMDPAKLKPRDRLELVALVPQRATDLLFLNSVSRELRESDSTSGAIAGSTARIFERLAGRLDPSIHPRDLSAGQKLALVLAIQLVKDAPLLLLDEPTQGLDFDAREKLAKILNSLAAEGKSILIASHDSEFVAKTCEQVLELGPRAK